MGKTTIDAQQMRVPVANGTKYFRNSPRTFQITLRVLLVAPFLIAINNITVGLLWSERIHGTRNTLPGPASTNEHIRARPVFFSKAKSDLAGSAVQDMLLAHAFCYKHNLTYGGACLPWFIPARRKTQELLENIGYAGILRYNTCPTKPSMLLDSKLFRHKDASLFSESWRQSLLAEHEQNVQSAVVSSNSSKLVFEIVAHIRRGDIDPCFKPERYLANSYYISLIERYWPTNNNLTVHVTIFSESDSFESFAVFRERNYTLRLDTDLSECWETMKNADVFIMSRSTFSYVPALLNTKTVCYTQFWLDPMKGWDIADPDILFKSLNQPHSISEHACEKIRWKKWIWLAVSKKAYRITTKIGKYFHLY